jgi:hypothetical protein
MSPTRQCPFQLRTTCDRRIVFIVCALLYAFSGGGCVRVGGRPSSFEAASSQIWASCHKDTRISLVRAWLAQLKHSSAIARYSTAVFIGRSTLSSAICCAGFPNFVCLRPDSTMKL